MEIFKKGLSSEKSLSFTKTEATRAVDRALELIKAALASGRDVLVSGFGKWLVRSKATRRGRNPQSGAVLILPARRVVYFKTSRVLKARVTKGPGNTSILYDTA